MDDCVTLWIGERLGPVERACLRSIVAQGHRVTLYSYGATIGIPEGVVRADAGDIIPEHAIFHHSMGSVGHFSDWFRYELQRRALGTWVDTDVYFLRPLPPAGDNLFGEQASGTINNAVLRLRPDSPLLADLLHPFERQTTPSWLPLRFYLVARMREVISGIADLGSLPWGSTGPLALTALARRYSMMSEALPADVFYPVRWQDAGWIADPHLRLETMVTKRTRAVHLWNECIRHFKEKPAPQGSFLQRLQFEGR